MKQTQNGFYEFFAGGGMARLGLGRRWRCLLANDNCPKKAWAYRANFPPAEELIVRGIEELSLADLPGAPALAWGSFPCQDLSLAGERRGLNGRRSGAFWPFLELMKDMSRDGRAVRIVVLENVVGAITSHQGRDFRAIVAGLHEAGYRVGPLVMNAVHFTPQSRPRLFVVAVHRDWDLPAEFVQEAADDFWHPEALRGAHRALPREFQESWLWWRLKKPRPCSKTLSNLIEEHPVGVDWHAREQTRKLVSQMSERNLQKLKAAQASGRRVIGTVYRRTRRDANGESVQRAEVRFDQISGCLRTPAGGSSRQIVFVVEGERLASRLLSAREAARLMGAPESYRLPEKYNEAYHLMGDGVAVPAVSWLERRLLAPIAALAESLVCVA